MTIAPVAVLVYIHIIYRFSQRPYFGLKNKSTPPRAYRSTVAHAHAHTHTRAHQMHVEVPHATRAAGAKRAPLSSALPSPHHIKSPHITASARLPATFLLLSTPDPIYPPPRAAPFRQAPDADAAPLTPPCPAPSRRRGRVGGVSAPHLAGQIHQLRLGHAAVRDRHQTVEKRRHRVAPQRRGPDGAVACAHAFFELPTLLRCQRDDLQGRMGLLGRG